VVGGRTVGRGVFEPGWRWSENVQPIAGTDSCQAPHLGYMGPGDVVSIPPGHDAEIVGDETCVFLDFSGFESYAKEE
jgi:hypothetical protein